MTTARWRSSSLLGIGPAQPASGWVGATAKTKSLLTPSGRLAMPLRAGMSPGAPMARSARPVARASQVPPSTSPVMRICVLWPAA